MNGSARLQLEDIFTPEIAEQYYREKNMSLEDYKKVLHSHIGNDSVLARATRLYYDKAMPWKEYRKFQYHHGQLSFLEKVEFWAFEFKESAAESYHELLTKLPVISPWG